MVDDRYPDQGTIVPRLRLPAARPPDYAVVFLYIWRLVVSVYMVFYILAGKQGVRKANSH